MERYLDVYGMIFRIYWECQVIWFLYYIVELLKPIKLQGVSGKRWHLYEILSMGEKYTQYCSTSNDSNK